MKYLLITAALWLTLCFSTNSTAQRGGGPYTLTIFADGGANGPTDTTQGSSGHGSNLGHVFVELTNGDKQMYDLAPAKRIP